MINSLKKIVISTENGVFIQFLRYVVVGGIAAVVDISLFHVGANILEINYIIVNTLSFTIATLVNYFLSRNWVFNNNSGVFTKDFLLFTIIGIIGIFLSNLILFVLIDCNILINLLPNLSASYIKLSAKIIAVCLVLFWSFFGRKKIMVRKN